MKTEFFEHKMHHKWIWIDSFNISRSYALRRNALFDAPRRVWRDAERPKERDHAERGHEQEKVKETYSYLLKWLKIILLYILA